MAGPGRDTYARVRLVPWTREDLPLLRRTNEPGMRTHLGGPESEEKLLDRHRRYLALAAADPATRSGVMFTLRPQSPDGASGGPAAGLIGYWETTWQERTVYETGWSVLPEFQGRGLAVAAAREVIARARAEKRHRHLHAFPDVANAASNALCRRAGFTLHGAHDLEYPPGRPMRCHDWRVDLT
jgi:RimJ/RimL family protein N-acetyltransferase